MSRVNVTTASRKYRRIDRACPCGGQAQVVGLITGGRERRRWWCEKCGTYYNKEEARKFEKIFVT